MKKLCFIQIINAKIFISNVVNVKRFVSLILTLQVPIPQNGQTHLNNSSTVADNRLSVLGHSVGLAFKGLILWVANNQKQSPWGVLSKGLFKNFSKFSTKHLYQSLFNLKRDSSTFLCVCVCVCVCVNFTNF